MLDLDGDANPLEQQWLTLTEQLFQWAADRPMRALLDLTQS